MLSVGERTHGLEHSVRLASIAAPLPRLYRRLNMNRFFTDGERKGTHGKRPICHYILLLEQSMAFTGINIPSHAILVLDLPVITLLATAIDKTQRA